MAKRTRQATTVERAEGETDGQYAKRALEAYHEIDPTAPPTSPKRPAVIQNV